MSKTKAIKQKTTGFDIMYRVVTAILAVAIYPAVYFADLITIELSHTDISNLLNNFTEESTLHATYETLSLYKLPEFIKTFSGFTGSDFDFKTTILQNALYRPVIVAVVFLAIALILGLVVLGFAIFSNKTKVITAISGAGFLCTVASYISFANFFAEPILAGETAISELLGIESSLISLILPYIGDVTTLALSGGFFAVMFLLLGICAWSVSVAIVNASEEKEKQMKKNAKSK